MGTQGSLIVNHTICPLSDIRGLFCSRNGEVMAMFELKNLFPSLYLSLGQVV